ncbi:hypothetical protein GJ496_008416 [Pomphorhynchus laevis]|nr:hypothetical protein GJ496_000515 [Pomphorhynchus laevis]KAI0987278.1 hypothetical protein GJ496_002025 [Pomphorhynchus laevis]KAI0987284.1 hypothetical protein GJ496_002030 [Pomphorhynchus laevis]KAI0987602.1 hypothetical protein GJ496_008416 [Pomphorhynchus laevis]
MGQRLPPIITSNVVSVCPRNHQLHTRDDQVESMLEDIPFHSPSDDDYQRSTSSPIQYKGNVPREFNQSPVFSSNLDDLFG